MGDGGKPYTQRPRSWLRDKINPSIRPVNIRSRCGYVVALRALVIQLRKYMHHWLATRAPFPLNCYTESRETLSSMVD